MNTRIGFTTLAVAAGIASVSTQAIAQHSLSDPHLHINTRWSECSFQLDPSLTKAQFRQFSGEAGVVTYFRPLADARPLGRGKFNFNIVQWKTGIDDREDAWNNTFVHPDSVHWLIDDHQGLAFPGLSATVGMSDRVDASLYLTKAPGANYGFVGGMVQYSLLNDEAKNWAVATRFSTVTMYGPEDVGFSVHGADVVVSRSYAVRKGVTLSPYGTLSASLSRAQEKSAVVDLDDANVLGAQGAIGASAQIGGAKLGVEWAVARVNSFSIRLGFGAK